MANQQSTRTEKDALGLIKVPKNAYYGSCTARALQNFRISGITAPKIFMQSLGLVKLAAIQANHSLKLIPKREASAIEKACKEFMDGKFENEFIVDVFQAGAGTSYNMNANEIIANRANELLKKKKGDYDPIHPNNRVNMAQSTNDVIPTATRIATLSVLPALFKEIKELEKELASKSGENYSTVKVGRTHLQDAIPITVGQELDSYREALKKSREFIEQQSETLLILGIGGTAVGTGLNTHPDYKKLMLRVLSKKTGLQFKKAHNSTEITNNMNVFMNLSASLRSLATNLLNICGDLKIMNMGPLAGISEVDLPAAQPGSSIMPGKINPSIPESMEMICMQVLGNDHVISLAAQKSNFELNVFCPVIMWNLLQSIEILTNGIATLREKCIKGMTVNKKRVKELFDKSLANATALAPYLGYAQTAEIVNTALEKGISVNKEILDRKIFTEKQLSQILSVKNVTNPSKKIVVWL